MSRRLATLQGGLLLKRNPWREYKHEGSVIKTAESRLLRGEDGAAAERKKSVEGKIRPQLESLQVTRQNLAHSI